ncbi:MAG: hypothetical protein BIFFINMI_00030 [Phycisphaerae bacterium]|nr:hypothetical protein [Phycisphaerae bacterium]
MSSQPAQLSMALKEWDVVCRAMLAGRQSLLLRKGGIHERHGRFEPEHDAFLLFPTFLHQQADRVQPEWRDQIIPRTSEPDYLRLPGWAAVTEVFEVPSRDRLAALLPLTIYEAPQLEMRWDYKPDLPLYVMALRLYRFADPPTIEVLPRYGGCRSWVPLERSIELRKAVAAMSDSQAEESLAGVREALI